MPVIAATAEVIVLGAGLIGLAVADALAGRGARVALIGDRRAGDASPAAAGMLAPTVEPLTGSALEFAIAARERYPEWLRALESRTGSSVSLNRNGILELAHSDERAALLRAACAVHGGEWLGPEDVRRLEPALAPVVGALLHPRDGAVDNVVLLDVLERAVTGEARVVRYPAAALELMLAADGARVRIASGASVEAPVLVLAAGAWSAGIAGLPRALPIEPARGQMISMAASVLRHVVFSEHAYLVPRAEGRTLVGATMERVGFDSATTPDALESLRQRGREVVPALGDAAVESSWAGLRPMTPDGLPILGADPEWPSLIYATGHSRNGILMAPVTGEVIADLALGGEPSFDLVPFDVRRFAAPLAPGPARA